MELSITLSYVDDILSGKANKIWNYNTALEVVTELKTMGHNYRVIGEYNYFRVVKVYKR